MNGLQNNGRSAGFTDVSGGGFWVRSSAAHFGRMLEFHRKARAVWISCQCVLLDCEDMRVGVGVSPIFAGRM